MAVFADFSFSFYSDFQMLRKALKQGYLTQPETFDLMGIKNFAGIA